MKHSFCFLILFSIGVMNATAQPGAGIRTHVNTQTGYVEHTVDNLADPTPSPPGFYTQFWWFGDNYFCFNPEPKHIYASGFGGNDVCAIHTPTYSTGGPPPLAAPAPGGQGGTTTNPQPILAPSESLRIQGYRNAVPDDTLYLIITYAAPQIGTNTVGFVDVEIAAPFDQHLSYDPAISNASFTPNQEVKSPYELKWNMHHSSNGNDRSFVIPLKVNQSIEPFIGQTVPITANLFYDDGTSVYKTLDLNISASHDPNSMYPSITYDDDCVMGGDTIIYRVNFQNIGDGPTGYVGVEVNLDPHLDISTFQELGFHMPLPQCNGSNKPCYEIDRNASQNKVTFHLNGVELEGLQSDTCTNIENTKGWLEFRIQVENNYHLGDDIVCQSEIVFDDNESMLTNEAITTCDEDLKVTEPDPTPVSKCCYYLLLVIVFLLLVIAALLLRNRKQKQ